MQLEIPIETVEYVKDLAVGMGKTVIIDPAPAVQICRTASGREWTILSPTRQSWRSCRENR